MLMQVAEVAARLGVTPTTVRLMEKNGKLRTAARTARGVRLFDSQEVERLLREREASRGKR